MIAEKCPDRVATVEFVKTLEVWKGHFSGIVFASIVQNQTVPYSVIQMSHGVPQYFDTAISLTSQMLYSGAANPS
jgi:hypothetical protein